MLFFVALEILVKSSTKAVLKTIIYCFDYKTATTCIYFSIKIITFSFLTYNLFRQLFSTLYLTIKALNLL